MNEKGELLLGSFWTPVPVLRCNNRCSGPQSAVYFLLSGKQIVTELFTVHFDVVSVGNYIG